MIDDLLNKLISYYITTFLMGVPEATEIAEGTLRFLYQEVS